MVDAFATKCCFYLGTAVTRCYALVLRTVPHEYDVVPNCGYGLVTLGEFGVVPLRENVPGIFMLPRAGGYHLVHGPRVEVFLKTENIMMVHSCHIDSETVVPFRPVSLRLSCFSV